MCAADNAPDGVVCEAADRLRHDLASPLTTIQGRAQLLARDIRRSPTLAEDEQVKMLAGITAIEAAVQAMCAVIDTISIDGRES